MAASTINDVAALAGVSIGTVSNVINKKGNTSPKTEAKVYSAIKELNYIPNTLAKDLKTSKSKTIGIIAEDVSAFMSGKIIDGIASICEAHDYAVSLYNLRAEYRVDWDQAAPYEYLAKSESFRKAIKVSVTNLLSSRIRGLIYIGIHPRDVAGLLPSLDIPVVYTYCFTKGQNDYCVNYDDYQGAKLAVDYLAEMGHRRIALISGPIDSIPAHKRMKGYTESLMVHDLTFDPAYVCTGNWHFEDGYRQCCHLLDMAVPPTAIFCMNDVMAFGALKACRERGIAVPEQLSIHGFDNLTASEFFSPALTTIDISLFQLGVETGKMLLNILLDKTVENRSVLVPCSHVLRSSAAQIAF